MGAYEKLHYRLSNPNDELYTLYEDIDVEIRAHLENNPDLFKDKIVYSPCDDINNSNFAKWFVDNRKLCGYKKYVCSSHMCDSRLLGGSDGKLSIVDGRSGSICKYQLKGSGDFRSNELAAYFDEADFIITNPPFSLSRDLYKLLHTYQKQWLVVGTILHFAYGTMLPYILSHNVMGGIQK